MHATDDSDATDDVHDDADELTLTEPPWSLFATIGEAFCVCEMLVDDVGEATDYRFLHVNELFEDATGLVDPVGRTALELVPDLERTWIDAYAKVALDGQTIRFEQGSEAMARWFDVVATPLGDRRRFAILFKDQTERHLAESEQRAIERQYEALADELPVIAWLHDRDGALAFVNQTYCDYFGATRDQMIDGPWTALTHPDDGPDYADDFAAAVRERRVFEHRVRVRRADGEWRWFESWGRPRFDTRGDYLGHIGASLDVTERVELEELRTAVLDRERRARHEAEILEHHAVRLSACVTVDDVTAATIEHLDGVFDLRIATVDLRDGDRLVIVAGSEVDADDVAAYQRIPITADLPGAVAIRRNEELAIEGRAAMSERFPELAEVFGQYQLDTLIAIPLRDQRGDALGAVVTGTADGHRLDHETLTLLRHMVARSGAALERAVLYEQLHEGLRREHAIAIRLQESLLPDHLVDVDGVEIATRYVAADDLLQVGGDWFDTFSCPGGEIGAIVGDVVGHDLEAAAQMGRLRAASAALIPLGAPCPGDMLAALERCARGPDGVDFVTATCVVLDPTTGRLAFGGAGHPPALLIQPDGSVRWLDAATVSPIGQLDHASWAEGIAELEPESVVLLYTDGLLERRAEVIDEGMDRLATMASSIAWDRDLGPAVDELVDALVATSPNDDDVIVLALRWRGVHP